MKKNEKNSRRITVLDTSAFLAGLDPFSLSEEQMTVPKVEEEIKKHSLILIRFETAKEKGKVKIKAPLTETLKKVQATASKIGDAFKLSETDKELLALALELKSAGFIPELVSDDYSIQNVASQLEIEFVSLATFGINRILEWIIYCPGCYRQYPSNSKNKECKICGTSLKRKPRRTIRTVKTSKHLKQKNML